MWVSECVCKRNGLKAAKLPFLYVCVFKQSLCIIFWIFYFVHFNAQTVYETDITNSSCAFDIVFLLKLQRRKKNNLQIRTKKENRREENKWKEERLKAG